MNGSQGMGKSTADQRHMRELGERLRALKKRDGPVPRNLTAVFKALAEIEQSWAFREGDWERAYQDDLAHHVRIHETLTAKRAPA